MHWKSWILKIREHKIDPTTFQSIMTQVKAFQDKVGYDNDYMAWVQKHLPERLENQLGSSH